MDKNINIENHPEEQLSKKELAQAKAQRDKEINARLDDGYDGYYDDVLPVAEKPRNKEVDKETIKKIAIIAVGGLAIIGFCVFIMFK